MTAKKSSTDRDVFKLFSKHVLGLSDNLIEHLRHSVKSAGQGDDMKRTIKKINKNTMTRLIKVLDDIHTQESTVKKSKKSDDDGIQFESFDFDFKSFLAEDAASMKAAGQEARAENMGTQAQRRIAGNMSDRDFVNQQAAEMEQMRASNDPIDRQILNLKKQLARLYQQKAQKQKAAEMKQERSGI